MSLKEIIFKKICSSIFDPLYIEGTWRVLVLDETSTKILSSIMKMSDIFDRGITHVDNIIKKREPVPLEAIYILSPSNNKTLQLLISDFSSTPTYQNAHVFFTDIISDDQMHQLGESIAANYIVTLKETYIQYLIKESQLFTLLNPPINDEPDDSSCPWFVTDDQLHSWARSLADICETLNEAPNIHFQNSDKANRFANYLKKEMDTKLLNNPFLGQSIHRDKSLVLILDRSFDPLTPLLHDLHLQSIAYDLLNIENDTYTYKNLETGKICHFLLSEDDGMWKQLRHMHMADVSRFLPMKLKQLANAQKSIDNTTATLQQQQQQSNPPDSARSNISALSNNTETSFSSQTDQNMTKQLRYMMKKMPHIRQEVISVSSMFHLSEACLKAYKAGLSQLCEHEQNLAIGTDASGDTVKNHDKMVGTLLHSIMTTMSEKIRLILIMILTQNHTSELSTMNLIQQFHIDDKIYKIFMGLCRMGNFMTNDSIPKIVPSRCFNLMNLRRQSIDGSSYTVSRWIPFIKDLMEDCISGRRIANSFIRTDLTSTAPTTIAISDDNGPFPQYNDTLNKPIKMDYLNPSFLLTEPNSNNLYKRHSWSTFQEHGGGISGLSSNDGDTHVGPRLIVFVIGGVSYAESRQVYDVTKACIEMKSMGGVLGSAGGSFNVSLSGNFLKPNKTKNTINSASRLENGGGRGWHWEVLIGSNAILTPEVYLEYLSQSS